MERKPRPRRYRLSRPHHNIMIRPSGDRVDVRQLAADAAVCFRGEGWGERARVCYHPRPGLVLLLLLLFFFLSSERGLRKGFVCFASSNERRPRRPGQFIPVTRRHFVQAQPACRYPCRCPIRSVRAVERTYLTEKNGVLPRHFRASGGGPDAVGRRHVQPFHQRPRSRRKPVHLETQGLLRSRSPDRFRLWRHFQ